MSRFVFRLRLAPAFRGYTAIAALMLMAGLGLSRPAQAASGLLGQVTPITAPSPTTNENFGFSPTGGTAVSTDGQTALMLAPFATVGTANTAGKAYIYHYAHGRWTLAAELDDPDMTKSDLFGSDGALSANGTVAIIGANYATVNGQRAGKAYVYTLSNGTWTLTHTFNDPAATSGDFFGHSVGLSADGMTAAAGAFGTTVNGIFYAGKAYIYQKTNGAWSQTAAIPGPDTVNYSDFGAVLTVSGDGSHVLIGSQAPVNGQSYAGKAYLYTLSNGSWTQTHEFDDPAATAYDGFGDTSVSLSANGQSAAIGASGTIVNGQTYAGTAYLYQASNGVWSQTAAIADPDAGAYDDFGLPVSISANGTSVLIGSEAPPSGTYIYAGKAYLYTQSNGSWTQTEAFDDPAATTGDYFGASGVALSGDGQTAVIGAGFTTINGASEAGAAYIYQSPADLSLALSPQFASVEQYENVALDATVYNTDSTVTANNVVLSFTLPAGMSYIAGNAGNGSCSASGQTATCTLASLAPGAVWQPTVRATALKTGMLTGTATVTSNAPNPATANNSASASVTVTPYPKTTGKKGSGSGGGGASTPLGLLALAALLGLAGLRRQALQRHR